MVLVNYKSDFYRNPRPTQSNLTPQNIGFQESELSNICIDEWYVFR